MKQKELEIAEAEEMAMLRVVEEKKKKIEETKKRLENERRVRAEQVLQLAKAMKLENTPEWSGTVKNLDQSVAARRDRNSQILTKDEAASLIQQSFM